MAKIKGAKFMHQIRFKRIHSEVMVSAQPGGKLNNSFYACVRVGGRRYRQRHEAHAAISTCSYCRTPRKAIAKALTKAARGVSGRRGVFAGYDD